MTPKHQLHFLLSRRPRGKRAAENALAVRRLSVMNMHEVLAAGPLLVTCVAQPGWRASAVRQGGRLWSGLLIHRGDGTPPEI